MINFEVLVYNNFCITYHCRNLQHENYNPFTLDNDIAVIELDDPAELNQYVDIVVMAEPADGDFAFVDCFIIGWGGDQCKTTLKLLRSGGSARGRNRRRPLKDPDCFVLTFKFYET